MQRQRAAAPSEEIRLIDHGHLGADRDRVEEYGDVFRIQAYAAVARAHSHAVGFVGTVNQVTRPPQAELIGTERIVRPGARLRRPPFSLLLMTLPTPPW